MKTVKQINIKSPIIKLRVLDNGTLAVIDSKNSLRIIELESYSVIGGFKSNVTHERVFGDHIDVDPQAKLSASILPGKNKAALFSVPKKKILYQIGRHKGDIESVAIEPNLNYFVTAGTDGKTFAWSLKTARLAFSMQPHSDYVTALTFSSNSQWLATGSFDKTIHVLHVATMKMSPIMHGHSSVIRKLIFLGSLKLISAEKNGAIIIWDRKKGTILERLKKLSDEITTMLVTDDEKYLFVGTKLGYIALYDLATYEQLTHKYIKLSTMICSLAFTKKDYRLIIGCEDGNLNFYSLFGDENRYETLIREKKYEEYYKDFLENPLLRYSKSHELLYKDWEEAYSTAKDYLKNNKHKSAKEILKPFMNLKEFTKPIQTILRDYKKYEEFLSNIKQKRYQLVYSMITQFPIYKESQEFQEMEKEWKKLFIRAKEYILKKDGDEIAKKLLDPFRGISQKTIVIKELFDNRKKYTFFKELIGKKDYFKVFNLVKQHPFLKEFPEYDMLEKYAEKLYIKAYQAYTENNFITAEKLSKILINFPDYKEDAEEMLSSLHKYQSFLHAFESSNLNLAFEYLEKYPILCDTPMGIELEEEWSEHIELARKEAATGKIDAIKVVLDKYLDISSKKEAIATVFKQAYMKQLDNAMKKEVDSKIIIKAMQRYVNTFGVDDFIELVHDSFSKKYKKSVDLDSFDQGNTSNWVVRHAYEYILE